MTAFRLGCRLRLTRPSVWPAQFPGAYLGWGRNGPIFTGPEHHALIIGPPRSGKTSAIIAPAIALWPGPVIATSTKPDLLHLTARRRNHYGQTWVWDPTGSLPLPPGTRPARWTPLQGCADWAIALQRAWALVTAARPHPNAEGAHWSERATALLATHLHAAALGGLPLSTLMTWITRRDTFEALDHLTTHPAVNLLHGIVNTDPRELSGIYSTADSVLAAYRNPHALDAADHPNYDPQLFAANAETLYLIAPADTAAQHAPIVCALLDQHRHDITNRPSPWPLMLWALDETANVAPLPTLPAVLADAGSQGLVILTCLQDLSQARSRWGPAADGFLTLHPTTVLLPGIADTATLRTITTIAGQYEKSECSSSKTGILKPPTVTTSRRRVPLLPEHVIAQGHPGYALRLTAAHPSWLALTPAHSTTWIRQLLQGDPR